MSCAKTKNLDIDYAAILDAECKVLIVFLFCCLSCFSAELDLSDLMTVGCKLGSCLDSVCPTSYASMVFQRFVRTFLKYIFFIPIQ